MIIITRNLIIHVYIVHIKHSWLEILNKLHLLYYWFKSFDLYVNLDKQLIYVRRFRCIYIDDAWIKLYTLFHTNNI